MTVEKKIPRKSPGPITRGAKSAMKQEEFLTITFNLLQARDNRPYKVRLVSVLVLILLLIQQARRRRQQKPHKFAYLTMEKQYFCTLCTCIFHFLTFCRSSRSFHDVK